MINDTVNVEINTRNKTNINNQFIFEEVIIIFPSVAGNIYAKFFKNVGSKSIENIIPDSIIDGIKTICPAITNPEVDLKCVPMKLPIPRLANKKNK